MNEKEILDQIRLWLKSGATIKATDVNEPVLEQQPDGSWIGGLYINCEDANVEYKEASNGA